MTSWTLYRYFFRRWAWPIIGALLFFGGLLFAFELKSLAQEIGRMPGASFRWLPPLLATTLPETLFMVLPMAALLGSLLGSQQLSESSEWVSSQGLGAGPKVLLVPWVVLGSALLVLATLNAHLLVPRMAVLQGQIRKRMINEGLVQALQPGGRPLFHAAQPNMSLWMSRNGQVHYMQVSQSEVQHLVAQRLDINQESIGGEITLNLHQLTGSTLRKTEGTVLQTQAQLHQMRLAPPSDAKLLKPLAERYFPTIELLRLRNREAWVELSRRFTLPFSVVSFLLLGLGLGMSHPRFHKGGALVKSLGVLLVYYFLVRFTESRYLAGRWSLPWGMFVLPWMLGLLAALLVWFRLRPHHTNRYASLTARLLTRVGHSFLLTLCQRIVRRCQGEVVHSAGWVRALLQRLRTQSTRGPVFIGWSTRAWLTRWMGTMAVFLTLSLFLEYVNLSGDLSANKVGMGTFLLYWLWGLPPFLSLVLPLAFLFAGVIMCSDAAASHEWVAIRASGAGILRWMGASSRAWMVVLLGTLALQIGLAPIANRRSDTFYNKILNRPAPTFRDSKPWLHLGANGVLWHLDGRQRWGFPLRGIGEAPVLLSYQLEAPAAKALSWSGLALGPGPTAMDLFPDDSLQRFAKAEHVPTLDLVKWQRWAPDPAQATMLWTRLLGWLAGPCLLFAVLAHAFPSPRKGRGQALGYALVAGLAFTGTQMIFGDAARLGELPAAWGVAAPLVLAVSAGLIQLPRLRT